MLHNDAAQDVLRVHYICVQHAFGCFAHVIECFIDRLHSIGSTHKLCEQIMQPKGVHGLNVLKLIVRVVCTACLMVLLLLLLAL